MREALTNTFNQPWLALLLSGMAFFWLEIERRWTQSRRARNLRPGIMARLLDGAAIVCALLGIAGIATVLFSATGPILNGLRSTGQLWNLVALFISIAILIPALWLIQVWLKWVLTTPVTVKHPGGAPVSTERENITIWENWRVFGGIAGLVLFLIVAIITWLPGQFSNPANLVGSTNPSGLTTSATRVPVTPATVTSDPEPPKAMRVKSDMLVLRINPGNNQPVVTTALQGSEVLVLPESPTTIRTSTWVKVRSGSMEGWVNLGLLE